MDNESVTKACWFCCEAMDVRAKRCPRCRMPQSRWAYAFHPAAVAAFMMLVLACMTAILLSSWARLGPGKDFTGYRDQLRVVRSWMVRSDEAEWPQVAVVGEVVNSSNVPWTDVDIQVRFMDQDGGVVDVADTVLTSTMGPGERRYFRADTEPYLPAERYASHEAVVQWAKEPR